MSQLWFTSDTHYGHKNILEFEKEYRSFSCVEEMNEALIDNWNAVVNKKDVVYHLGDVAFGRDNLKLIERLKGDKRLIMGNHDNYSIYDYLKYFKKVYGVKYLHELVLSHIPVHHRGLRDRHVLNVSMVTCTVK